MFDLWGAMTALAMSRPNSQACYGAMCGRFELFEVQRESDSTILRQLHFAVHADPGSVTKVPRVPCGSSCLRLRVHSS